MPSAEDVANYFLASVDEEAGDSLSNLKLQKLCYYAQGYCLALRGAPLFPEEIQAWLHGPVVPSLYYKFRQYKADPIPRPEGFDPSGSLDRGIREILDEVNEVYGQFTASKLRNMTHAEPPWALAYAEAPSTAISHQVMREYFSTLIA